MLKFDLKCWWIHCLTHLPKFWGLPQYKCDDSPRCEYSYIWREVTTNPKLFFRFYFYRWESAVLSRPSSLWKKGIKSVFFLEVNWNCWLDNTRFQWFKALVSYLFHRFSLICISYESIGYIKHCYLAIHFIDLGKDQ